jgi:hypothetical protein
MDEITLDNGAVFKERVSFQEYIILSSAAKQFSV